MTAVTISWTTTFERGFLWGMLFKYFTQWEIRRTFSILYKVFEKYRKVSKYFHYKSPDLNFKIQGVWRDFFLNNGIFKLKGHCTTGFWVWRDFQWRDFLERLIWAAGFLERRDFQIEGNLNDRILRLTGYYVTDF